MPCTRLDGTEPQGLWGTRWQQPAAKAQLGAPASSAAALRRLHMRLGLRIKSFGLV